MNFIDLTAVDGYITRWYIYMYTRKFLTFHNFFLYITNISIFPRVQFRPLPLGERNSTFHLSLTGAIISRSNFTPLHISIGRFLFIKLDVGRNRPLPPTEWNRRRMGGGGFDQVLETRNPLITRSSATSWKGFSVEKKVAISCPRARQHRTLRGSNKSRFSTGGGPLLLLLQGSVFSKAFRGIDYLFACRPFEIVHRQSYFPEWADEFRAECRRFWNVKCKKSEKIREKRNEVARFVYIRDAPI